MKFLSNSELASASTDSTLRLWDVKENLPVSNVLKKLTSFFIHAYGMSDPDLFIVTLNGNLMIL